ncbi:alkaline phosphatase family protein [Compostibacter hankyongensis]
MHHKVWKALYGLAALLFAALACNKGFDRILEKRDYTDTTSSAARTPKVLYIVVDGARGQSVRDAKPPTLLQLNEHAIYSWYSITDTLTLDATGWADLLTGVHKEKHQVLSNDFSGNKLDTYPVFFRYIKDRKPEFRIAAFSSSNDLGNRLITDADVNRTFGGNDAAAQAAALNELKLDSAGLVFLQFKDVDQAGARYGYDVSVPQYKAAILKVDGYIGKLMEALRARKNFSGEDWLVVITANHGGPFPVDPAKDDHTILSDPRVNGFTIYYSPVYEPSMIDKPYTGNRYAGQAVRLHDRDANAVNAVVPDDGGDYNFGDTTSFTVEFKVKVNPGPKGDYTYTYPSILGKRESFDPGKPGWVMFLEQHYWMINFGQVGKGNIQVKGADISDGTWHDIAAVILNRKDGAGILHRYARTYTNGVFNNEGEITAQGNINTMTPLTMGFLPGSVNEPADVYMSEVKIWRAVLPDSTISAHACETELSSDHPYNDYLIGYWPCTDGFGGQFTDNGPLQHSFSLRGAYQWEDYNDLVCPPSSSDLATLAPQPTDIARQILNWLKVITDTKWDLDGRVWTTDYTNLAH